jgi:phosphoribosyl-AMP cyclohydrolase
MDLNFEKADGLVPAIVQDAASRQVLMVGYMNRDAWNATVATGNVTFFSRSRIKLWTKGETSGHFLKVREIFKDCDEDALLILADPIGPGVCHEGYVSCFYRKREDDGSWYTVGAPAFDKDAVYGGSK